MASQSQSMLFYVPSHDAGAVARLVEFLQQQPWVGVVFTRGGREGHGSVPGTFSLDVTQGSHASRSPDVAVTLKWTSSRNPYGVPGTQTITSGKTGPLTGGASGHGGLSPWVVRNTLVLWGGDFKARARIEAPASLADLMPTVLSCLRSSRILAAACGRVTGGVAARIARSQAEAIAPDADDGIGPVSSRAPDLERRGPRLRRRRCEAEVRRTL